MQIWLYCCCCYCCYFSLFRDSFSGGFCVIYYRRSQISTPSFRNCKAIPWKIRDLFHPQYEITQMTIYTLYPIFVGLWVGLINARWQSMGVWTKIVCPFYSIGINPMYPRNFELYIIEDIELASPLSRNCQEIPYKTRDIFHP